MRFEFTPAAERALTAAAGWSSCADVDELRLPEVLWGLLAEPECRAALLAAPYGIDAASVRHRFPSLVRLEPFDPRRAERFSADWLACLHAAEALLIDYPRPLVLATEHLLLGIAAVENEISAWLRERGLRIEELESEVHRLSGHYPGPLPLGANDEGDGLALAVPEGPTSVSPREQVEALRIIDAAANRANEGLRVVEDYLRFALDDRHLTEICKHIRHELAAALAIFSVAERHASRETQADVGTTLSLASEQLRSGPADVVAAGFQRVEQSLRSLEEFSKSIEPAAAATLEQLRYRVYTLERVVGIAGTSLERLAAARLYVLVDGCSSAESFRSLIEALVAADVSILQLRDKRLDDRELLARARLLREATAGTETLFIMNDRPDLALLSRADGVHVGQDELTVKDARGVLGPRGLIGVSTHSLAQARAAVLDGANYLGVGPTFASSTKDFSQFTGPELLHAVHAEIRLPAFAIGGITLENLPQVLATGLTRVAVSGAVTGATDPAAAARALRRALDESRTD